EMKALVRYAIVGTLVIAASATTVEMRAQDAPVAVGAATPAPTVEALFADTSAKEAAVRKALASPSPSTTLLKAVRTVVDDYESLARRYPGSTQADDALWRGGKLSADALAEFHDAQEQASAVRLFKALNAQYPTSRLAKQSAAQLAALKAMPVAQTSPAPAPASPPATPPASRPPTRTTHVPRPIPQPSTPP